MKKEDIFLIITFVCLALISLGFAKYKENVKACKEAHAAAEAVKIHYNWFESAQRYKDKTGHNIDGDIFASWAKISKGSSERNPEEFARAIFASYYEKLDYQIPQSYITDSMAFTDGKWSYVIRLQDARQNRLAEGLVNLGTNINSVDLSFVLNYLPRAQGQAQRVEVFCLPINSSKLKVCKKTFKLLAKENNSERQYGFPAKVNINTIDFNNTPREP